MTTKTTLRKKLKLHDHLFQNEGTPLHQWKSHHVTLWKYGTVKQLDDLYSVVQSEEIGHSITDTHSFLALAAQPVMQLCFSARMLNSTHMANQHKSFHT